MMQTREESNTETSLLNAPLASAVHDVGHVERTLTRMSRICSAPATVTGG
jgi:hypothetical protein